MWQIVKYKYRVMIKFLTLEKQSANNIHERLRNVYGDSAASYATVARWVVGFKRVQNSKHRWKMAPVLDGQLRRPRMIVVMLLKCW